MIKIGFTGARAGMTFHQKYQFCYILGQLTGEDTLQFHHGDCVGADAQAHQLVRELNPQIAIHSHPPLNESKRAFEKADITHIAKEYLERNREIVNSTDMLIGTPSTPKEELRSGTWATIRFARKQKKPLYLILPDGRITEGG